MTLAWDYASGPEDFSEAIGWNDLARIWADDATDVYPELEVQQVRASYCHLIVVEGEVVRIEQQYKP